MLPEVTDTREMDILSWILSHGTPFFSRGALGKVSYQREIDLTLGREEKLFSRLEDHPDVTVQNDGSFIAADGSVLVPLVEGRMVGQYDFFQKSWIRGRGRTAEWRLNRTDALEKCRPQFVAPPALPQGARIAICDVTSATNTRTVHACWVPETWPCGNSAPTLRFERPSDARAGLAVMNSMIFDWVARRIVGGLHLNKFYLDVLVWPKLTPDAIGRLVHASNVLLLQNPRFAAAKGQPIAAGAEVFERAPSTSSLPLFASADEPDEFLVELNNAITDVNFVPDLDEMGARVLIEREVAAAFGLTGDMLRRIYDDSADDRRGFWRYFRADPRAREVVNQVLNPTVIG
jgi:hypothetical protein